MPARPAPALVAVLLFLGCATPLLEAMGPPDWGAVADERVPRIVTVDPDGDVRETKLWIVVVDGTGFVRTSNTRWFRNIERDPNVVLQIGGTAHPLRARLELDAQVRERVNRAFREKYGFEDRLVGWFGRPEDANILRLLPR